MSLLVLRQVRLLSETLSTQLTGEGLLSRMCAHMHIDTVFVLEALVTDVAIVEEAGLFLGLLLGAAVVLPDFGKVVA